MKKKAGKKMNIINVNYTDSEAMSKDLQYFEVRIN